MYQLLLPLLFLISGIQLLSAQNIDESKVSPDLIQTLNEQPEAFTPFYILLKDQVDVLQLKANFDQNNASQAERTEELIGQLKAKARLSQERLLSFLQNHEGLEPFSLKSYWITNMIYVRATQVLASALSRHEAVAFLEAPLISGIIDDPTSAQMATSAPNGRETGLTAINAHKLWEMGYSGYGQVALILDTGTEYNHPALQHNYRGLYFDQSQTFNGVGENPTDCNGHGTHVAGTICGLDRLKRDTLGVAFNAHWISGPVNLVGGCSETVSDVDNFQWALDPDGDPTTTADMPAAINNSWGSNSSNCLNQSGLANILNALETAGIAVVWAAGNSGSDPSTITTQGNINNDLVNSFAVGALNGNNPDFPITNFSSRGPSTCAGAGPLRIKPEVSAPGRNVRSAYPGGGYRSLNGTSMAAPHVAGAITLLKEAFPNLMGETLKLALYYSAVDLGAVGEDNVYGTGMIDLYAAYNYLIDQGHQPVDPKRERDALMVDVITDQLFCGAQTSWEVVFENGGTTDLTNLTVRYRILYNTDQVEAEGQLTWTGNLAPGGRTNMVLPDLSNLEGIYDFEVVLDLPNGESDERPLNNKLLKKNLALFSPAPLQVSIVGEELGDPCIHTNAILTLDAENVVDINWYVQASGGVPIASGPVYTTPPFPTPFTFYVDPVFETRGGIEEKTINSAVGTAEEGMVFDVYTDLLLKSVTLQVESPGMQIVTIKNPDGETIFSQIYTPTASGDFIVDLNIELTRGNAYQITVEGSSELAYETAANYPYSVGHVLSIRQSTDEAHLQDRYYYFYDWVVEHHYICGREAIRVEFTNTPDAPVAAFTPSTTLVNTDQPGPVSFFNETENATTYRWDFGDGTNSTVENPVHEYSAPGTYLVTLSASNEATCVATVSVNIVVEEVVVSTTTPELAQQILLFPNPSSGVIQLQIPENAPAMERIVIFDGMGNALWQQAWNGLAANAYQLDLGDYPAGVYHLVLYSEEQKIVKKVVLF